MKKLIPEYKGTIFLHMKFSTGGKAALFLQAMVLVGKHRLFLVFWTRREPFPPISHSKSFCYFQVLFPSFPLFWDTVLDFILITIVAVSPR